MSKILNDQAISTSFHVTSLFSTKDLFYNPTQVSVSNSTLVFCAHVGNGFFALGGYRTIREINQDHLHLLGLMPLNREP
jgi:hypothetical protein